MALSFTSDVKKLEKAAAALKKHGDKELSRELTKGITSALKPLKKDVKSSTPEFLPRRGGLAKRVGKTTLPHRTRKAGIEAGVRITAKPSHRTLRDPLRVDRGRVKHPVFGRAASVIPWQLQNVKPGWFSKPLEDGAKPVRKALVKAIGEIVSKIERST